MHDLRQRSRIAKHVWEPQNLAVLAEFPLEKALSVQELPHERFAGGQVRVGLDPHAALDLPASLCDTLFDLGVKFRVVLPDKIIELRL